MSLDWSTALAPPLLTADLPGVGGRIKSVPEDFDVEEIPAYEPSGNGDFLYLWLEKRGMGAEYFTRQVAHRLGIPSGEVGTAGLKDRHAVTRQWVSVPVSAEPQVPQLEGDGIRVLKTGRHSNKLRPGHLHGNRFRVMIRDIATNVDIQPILERMRQQGLPNFYGAQRFGNNGETLHLGLALLLKQPPPISADGRRPNHRNPFLRKFALSAVQSALFNHYLAARVNEGLLHRVTHGDVMAKWPFGGMFVAEDVAAEQTRFDVRETVSAGPIFGRKTFPAKYEAAAREAMILTEAGLSRESFAQFGKLMAGTRRHNLIYIDDLNADLQLTNLQLTFTLPAGSYATVLLQHVMKTPVIADDNIVEE
ncbi:MAG TPA: tRNA pseudouridine(13) synthase TruD [Gemmataceae bacterium]|nr:tRNA pseudouridine(13) synthase TruD [Gemmataceae bacterium]